MKYFFAALLFVVISVVVIAGFRGQRFDRPPLEVFPDMDRQPKKKAQTPSDFFANGLTARQPVDGTVPMGFSIPNTAATDYGSAAAAEIDDPFPTTGFTRGDEYLATGRVGEYWGDGMPIDVTPAVIARGAERYGIHCAVCHDPAGNGKGITSNYGFAYIASLHEPRLLETPDGDIYNTIVNGKNTMYGYKEKISVEDRWAIVAYVRTLQRAQAATLADVPQEAQEQLNSPTPGENN